ncbi:MAG: class I SAM-dependent methyltransferase [Candidatus Cloacimonetes bacterium]|nr:class I SAM-dependent methyltransferase [Candidatus Cloacimonadota bacterium]
MSQNNLNQQWQNLADPWIKEMREGSNANRKGLLDPPMLEACGNINGKKILDCGCGEGRFSRMLAKRGAANVLGIDLCEKMIEAARELKSEAEEYRIADVQDLSFIQGEEFDLAISYLNQCDLPDFIANTNEVFRILKPGGKFIIANLHPMRSAVGCWLKDDNGKKKHVVLDDYFAEGQRHWKMMGVELTNFHRTLATYTKAYSDAGFSIERIIEPTATAEMIDIYPELIDELRVPNFIIYILSKN